MTRISHRLQHINNCKSLTKSERETAASNAESKIEEDNLFFGGGGGGKGWGAVAGARRRKRRRWKTEDGAAHPSRCFGWFHLARRACSQGNARFPRLVGLGHFSKFVVQIGPHLRKPMNPRLLTFELAQDSRGVHLKLITNVRQYHTKLILKYIINYYFKIK